MKKKSVTEPTTLDKLDALIARYGSIEKAAHEIGCTERSVRRWRDGKGILAIYEREIDRAYQALLQK